MIVNGLTIEQAIGACYLHGTVPLSTLYSRVQARRDKGTYDVLIRKSIQDKLDMVIDLTGGDDEFRNISPVTMNSTNSSSFTTLSSTASSRSTSKRSRRSSKQASAHKLELKRRKLDYELRYKTAFKTATNLVASSTTGEPVGKMCDRLNVEYSLDGSKRLARSTVYQASKDGLAGCSPTGKKGPESKIPIKLMEMAATHAGVCQVGDGELKGKDLKRFYLLTKN